LAYHASALIENHKQGDICMSGTPEYYFEQRWIGLESLAQIIGSRTFSIKRNSVELSLGEKFQDLVTIIESLLACSFEIRDALFENKLSEDAFHHDISMLERRVEQAVATLNEGVSEVMRMKVDVLVSLANHRAKKHPISNLILR
jgi:hypothetical protein